MSPMTSEKQTPHLQQIFERQPKSEVATGCSMCSTMPAGRGRGTHAICKGDQRQERAERLKNKTKQSRALRRIAGSSAISVISIASQFNGHLTASHPKTHAGWHRRKIARALSRRMPTPDACNKPAFSLQCLPPVLSASALLKDFNARVAFGDQAPVISATMGFNTTPAAKQIFSVFIYVRLRASY